MLHGSLGTLQYAIPRLFLVSHRSDFYSHLERTWLKIIIIITSITWRFGETSPGPCFTGNRIRTNRSSYVMFYFGVTQEKRWIMQLFMVNVIDKKIKTDQPLLNENSTRTDQGRAIVIHSRGSILLSHGKNNCLKQLLGQYQPTVPVLWPERWAQRRITLSLKIAMEILLAKNSSMKQGATRCRSLLPWY